MNINDIFGNIADEVSDVCKKVDAAEAEKLASEIDSAENIFIHGNGRSGLAGKMIAMRLMHSGYNVYVVSETTTPAFRAGDLLIILSGSGKGHSVEHMLRKVRSIGGRAALVTAADDAQIRQQFNAVLYLNASTKHNEITTIQPLGSQFDQAVHLILDGLIVYLNQLHQKGNDALKAKHFNLE